MKTYCLYPSLFMDIRWLPSIDPETSNVQVTVVDKVCPTRYSPFTEFLDTGYCKSYGTATSKIIMTAAPFPRMPQIYEPLRTFSTGAYLLIPAYTHTKIITGLIAQSPQRRSHFDHYTYIHKKDRATCAYIHLQIEVRKCASQ